MSSAKIILVTGGNRGIGLGIVQRLLETDSSATVIIGARSHKNAAEAISKLEPLGLKPTFVELDITSDASVASAVKSIDEKYGRLDVLVNNAAVGGESGTLREVYSTVLVSNVVSTVAVIDAFLPLLQKSSDARIINLSSRLGSLAAHQTDLIPPGYMLAYCASKAALNLIGIEFERIHPEITVQAVNPGFCKTELNGYRGTREPTEGANVVVVLAFAEKGKYPGKGFWETTGDSMEATPVPF